MGSEVVFISLVAAFAAFWGVSWYFSKAQTTRRALRDAPLVLSRDAREGSVVKVQGRLEMGVTALEAPLSGRRCAAFRVIVDVRKDKSWRTLIDRSSVVPFFVRDGDDRVAVRATVPELLLVVDHRDESGFLNDPTPALRAFLSSCGEEPTNFLGLNRTLRYREAVLESNETVAVLGKARWEPDPDPAASSRAGYRDRALRLVIEAPPGASLYLSDDPSLLGR